MLEAFDFAHSQSPLCKRLPLMGAIALAVVVAFASSTYAQVPETDLDAAAELGTEKIGQPVHSFDGIQVGTVDDIYLNDVGVAVGLRMKAGSRLGIGPRIVEVPCGAFILLRGAVVIDLPAAAVPLLPDLTDIDAASEGAAPPGSCGANRADETHLFGM